MKKIKNYAALILSALMLVSLLAACGGKTSDSSPAPAPAPAPASETPASDAPSSEAPAQAPAEAYPADIQKIIDRGVLKVGVKNAVIGFGYQDPLTQEYSGLEITLAEKIAEKLGVKTEYTAVTAATRTELLDSGDIDCVLATFTITEERKKNWDFSTPYYTDYVTVLVEDSSGIKTLTDLADKKVGVSSGSTSAKALVKAMIEAGLISQDSFNEETFDPATWTTTVSFQQYDDYPTISTALSAREIDAFCVDKSILAVYHTAGRSYIAEKFAPQNYGVATKKGSALSPFIEELITGWLADGTVDQLIKENNLE